MSQANPPVAEPKAHAVPASAPFGPAKRQAFGWTYWMLNSIEMFERLAYFGIRSVVPLYIMQATEPGGLHMTAVHKGWVYMWWAVLQSWLPMFTGGIADRYGYKRVLVFAISVNAIGYLMMAGMHSYYGFFAGILVLATGTAFFKPALQGSIAQNLTKEHSSMGWGIFYWVVNVGAVLAPVLATVILGKPHSAEGWRNLFLASAAYTACNLLLLFTFRDVPSGADKSLGIVSVFVRTIENVWFFWFRGGTFHWFRGPLGIASVIIGLGLLIATDHWLLGLVLFLIGTLVATWLDGGTFTLQLRLPLFLLIMSCFWMMMYQLWDLHPNFIVDWIDSSMVADHAPRAWQEYGDRGLVQVPQQILLNLNAALIVLLVVPISWLVRKMRTLSAMLVGMMVATIGILVAGLTGNGWIFLLGVVFFSLGEMLTGPKKNQYLGLIAPPGKKGLYLGYVNIPVGVGVGLGSMIAGVVYDNYGEKATLALYYLGNNSELVARAAQAADWSDTLEKIPELTGIDRSEAFELACRDLEQDAETAAETLRQAFCYDRGQIENLALQYVALHPEYRKRMVSGFAALVKDTDRKLSGKVDGLVEQAKGFLEPKDEPAELRSKIEDDLPAAGEALAEIERLGEMIQLVRALARGDRADCETPIARYIHLLPKTLDVKRVVAFELVRDLVNRDLPLDQQKQDTHIIALLWDEFGNDPEVVNNLALEYLAQSSGLVHDAVANLTFDRPPEQLKDRTQEIEERIGIDRTKSFAALSVALGADDESVDRALEGLYVTANGPYARTFAFLADRPHLRFLAVAQKDWTHDRDLLRAIVRSDAQALQTVLDGIDQQAWYESVWAWVKRIFVSDELSGEVTEEGVNYHRLAGKPDLIQKALAAKDWSDSPEQAAQLLGLNPFEARALVAAEVNHAPFHTTRLLWSTYHPQYKVWLPFAAIGVAAAIALAIFGQLAKKWADMNA